MHIAETRLSLPLTSIPSKPSPHWSKMRWAASRDQCFVCLSQEDMLMSKTFYLLRNRSFYKLWYSGVYIQKAPCYSVPHWTSPMWTSGIRFACCLLNVPAACLCSSGQICSDNFMCCHTDRGVAVQTFHLTQSQYTDTEPTSPSTDPIEPGTWHWPLEYQFLSHWYDSTRNNPGGRAIWTLDLLVSRLIP